MRRRPTISRFHQSRRLPSFRPRRPNPPRPNPPRSSPPQLSLQRFSRSLFPSRSRHGRLRLDRPRSSRNRRRYGPARRPSRVSRRSRMPRRPNPSSRSPSQCGSPSRGRPHRPRAVRFRRLRRSRLHHGARRFRLPLGGCRPRNCRRSRLKVGVSGEIRRPGRLAQRPAIQRLGLASPADPPRCAATGRGAAHGAFPGHRRRTAPA
jgi:hypothetical protein